MNKLELPKWRSVYISLSMYLSIYLYICLFSWLHLGSLNSLRKMSGFFYILFTFLWENMEVKDSWKLIHGRQIQLHLDSAHHHRSLSLWNTLSSCVLMTHAQWEGKQGLSPHVSRRKCHLCPCLLETPSLDYKGRSVSPGERRWTRKVDRRVGHGQGCGVGWANKTWVAQLVASLLARSFVLLSYFLLGEII